MAENNKHLLLSPVFAGWPSLLLQAVDYQVGWYISASHISVWGPVLLRACSFHCDGRNTRGQTQDGSIVKASAHITSTNTPLTKQVISSSQSDGRKEYLLNQKLICRTKSLNTRAKNLCVSLFKKKKNEYNRRNLTLQKY